MTTLNSAIGPNADMVARYRFISKGDNVEGFYAGNTFANQIGISTQVPYVIEIVSNNVSNDGEALIGNRRFIVRKPVVPITKENMHVLQMLDLLVKIDAYLDCSYEEAWEKFAEYISVYGITRRDVDLYITKYPISVLKAFYKLKVARKRGNERFRRGGCRISGSQRHSRHHGNRLEIRQLL